MLPDALSRHRKTLSFLAVLFVSAIPLLIPCSETYTIQIKLFLAVTFFAILSIAADTIPLVVVAVLLPVSYFVLKIAPMKQVYDPWTSSTLWMMFGAFVLANALDECGLMERIAYWILRFFGASYNTLLYGIYVVGLVLGILTFSGHYVIMVFLAYSICKALGYSHDRESLLILVVGGMAALTVKIFCYRPATMILMLQGVHTVVPDFNITMLEQMTLGLPSVFASFGFIWFLTKVFHTGDIRFEGGRSYFRKRYQELGAMDTREKKAAVLLAVNMVWIITEPLHGYSAALAFMTLPWLCFVPGIDIATTQKSVQRLNWGVMFFIAASLTIGAVGNQIGVTNLITDAMLPYLQNAGASLFLYLVVALGTVLNFIVTPIALLATLPAPVTAIAQYLNVDPAVCIITILYSTDLIFLPFEIAAYLILFGFGLMSLKDFVKLETLKSLWFFVMFGLLHLPYWYLIGALYTH